MDTSVARASTSIGAVRRFMVKEVAMAFNVNCSSPRADPISFAQSMATCASVENIRTPIIHKGFPNLLPIVFEDNHVRNKPAMTKNSPKVKFDEESTKETITWFSHPKNYNEIKDK